MSILLIFDIDETLVKTGLYHFPQQVAHAIYDIKLLSTYLSKPEKYQVALASFNNDPGNTPYILGKNLGRLILNICHPTGNSFSCVEDDFIQCWKHSSFYDAKSYCKNMHISNILDSYVKKYMYHPSEVLFFDDMIDNVYNASKYLAVDSYLVKRGLSLATLPNCLQIGTKIELTCDSGLENCTQLKSIESRIYKNINKGVTHYTLYLPTNINLARDMLEKILAVLNCNKLNVKIVQSDI